MSAGSVFDKLSAEYPEARSLIGAGRSAHRQVVKTLRKEAEAAGILEQALRQIAEEHPMTRSAAQSALELSSRKRAEALKGRIA